MPAIPPRPLPAWAYPRRPQPTPALERPLLALGAMLSCCALTRLPALPASAEIVAEQVVVLDLQDYQANWYPMAEAVRDDFSISTFTVVQWPVPAGTTISSYYGWRGGQGVPSDHGGIDLNPGNGHPIQSIAEGVVVEVSNGGSAYGVYAVVEHDVDGDTVRTLYGHMQNGSLTVGVGQAVSRGEILGLVGSTGLSTGPHLHFEVHVNGVEVDPLPWLQLHANS